MWLKNIDTYIKDKLKSYKPSYTEDLWKGIEQNLPPSRVPNGQGSWLIAAAAAVVVIVMVPFFLKFNNAVDERQAIGDIAKNVTPKGLSATGNTLNPGAFNDNSNKFPGNKINGALKPVDHIDLKTTANKLQEKTLEYPEFHHNIRLKTDNHPPVTIKKTLETENETISPDSKPVTLKSIMKRILNALYPDQIDNVYADNVRYKKAEGNNKKYKDYPSHADQQDRANWQSIFYPFWENPAYTGSEGRYNFFADDKQEYIPEAKTTKIQNNFAFDMRIPSFGLGLGIFNTRELTQFSLQSTYGISLSKIILHRKNSVLKVGVAATMINNTLFYNSLNFSDQISPIFGIWKATQEKDPSETTTSFGINAGIWYINRNFMGGIDVSNLNQPRPHHLSEAQPLPRVWLATAGYHISAGTDFQFLPMIEVRRQDGVNQLSTTFTTVFKNKFMATVAYQDISPKSSLGNLYFYAGLNILKKFRVFAGYGVNTELQQVGINDHFVHAGIKYQIR